jgi:hypothetical protein
MNIKLAVVGLLFILSASLVLGVAVAARPKLSVGSCLIQSTNEFEVKAVAKDAPGEWRLFRYKSPDYIDLGMMNPGDEKTVTTPLEGTWVKKYKGEDGWIQRGGTHVTSIDGHTNHGFFCPEPDPIPEFGLIGVSLAVLGIAGIVIAKRH